MKLKAYYPDDGSGVVEIESRLYYIEFPYTQDSEYPCTYEHLDRLVLRQDFLACDIAFSDGPSLIDFLKGKANEGESPLHRELDEQSFLNRYNSFPVENLRLILEATERQLVMKEGLEKVERALNRLLDLEKVQGAPELFQKARDLWRRCKAEMNVTKTIKQKPKVMDLEEIQRIFPLSTASSGPEQVAKQANESARKLVA